ncbi:MAG: biotin--[acetyl-CoA-carboxylase] ligase, partial [candidate division Zixibacteria bacterium]|nr:biotin--[acetyl-CoA-carboxylase] ligase [candidate division Zixibacteria bacterium]
LSPEMNPQNLEQLADRVLEKIRNRPGQFFDPIKLSKNLKEPEQKIVSGIILLRNWGYSIKSNRKGQYAFLSPPDSLIPNEILYKLKTRYIGKRVNAYHTVQSTNSIASQLAANGAPEGTMVIAERQTRGRGRMGRQWYSPEKKGLYCSIILCPKLHPTLAPGISLMTATALADTISSYDDMDVKIKWPNDILISGRKVSGILTELSAELDRINYVIVGVGININQKMSDFPEELRNKATSVRIGIKEKIRRVEFLQKFLLNFENEYRIFKKSGLEQVRKKILKYSFLHNKEIKLKSGRKLICGTVIDIDKVGQLVVDTKDGIFAFNAGEVTTC